jgi:uncharacterized membrane protein
MKGRWTWVWLVTVVALSAIAPASANASDPYTFRDLTSCCVQAGTSTTYGNALIAAAVNDNGDVVGTASGANGTSTEAYILHDGQFTVLSYLASLEYPYGGEGGSPFTGADDLNDSDVVVGWSSDGFGTASRHTNGGGEHPAVWRPFAAVNPSDAAFDVGQFEASTANACDQTTPTDCYGVATNVNSNSDVTGYSEYADYPNAENDFFLFPFTIPGGARPLDQVPATVPGPEGVSTDMVFFEHETKPFGGFTTSGITTGATSSGDQFVVWPDPNDVTTDNSGVCTSTSGGAASCTSVPLDASYHAGVRHAVNDSGWVIGTNDTTGIAGVWEKGTVVNLPPLPGDATSEATAINDNGEIVGASVPASGCPSAVEWAPGAYDTPINLGGVESTKDETLFVAQDVSDTGNIVGQGGTCNGGSFVGNAGPWELIAPTPTVHKLTVTETGTGHGTVVSGDSPVTLSCPATCSHAYPAGIKVTLTATPSSTSTFAGFTGGGCSGTATTCAVTMTSDQDVTAKFNGPPPPKCTLKAPTATVALKTTRKAKAGALSLTAGCNQTASGTLTGTLLEIIAKATKHAKQKSKTFKLGPVKATVTAGKAKTFTVTVPKAALTALKAKKAESIAFVLVATNVNGSGRAVASIGHLHSSG